MNYKNLTPKQIYLGETNYTLADFMRNFREKLKKDWGSKLIDKGNKSKTIYQGIFIIIVFASQGKSLKMISKFVLGKSTGEPLSIIKEIIAVYKQEAEILEGIQMKMFLDNLKQYGLSDSLNLKLLNADFRIWLKEALNYKN